MGLKRTPLFPMHQKYGGKLVDFGGWELSVQFSGIIKEHHMVRSKAGLFDVSHMGEIEVTGEKAQDFIQYLVTNDAKKLNNSQVMYSLMCYEDGGIVDDLLVYKYNPSHFLLVVNAANTEKDFAWIREHAPEGVEVKNVSDHYAQLALQGPKAQEILQKLTDTDLETIDFFWFKPDVKIAGASCIVSRTGYTGEDGFEIYIKPEDAVHVWEEILKAGGEEVVPVGLGARDTLRFEAKLPLYGQEIDKDITPLEAGLGYFVKLKSEDDFIGKNALLKQKEEGLKRILVEFEMIEKGIPRHGYEVYKEGEKIGWVTSGAHSPTFDRSIGLALIKKDYSAEGTQIDIMIRNKPVKARVMKNSFYQKQTRNKKNK